MAMDTSIRELLEIAGERAISFRENNEAASPYPKVDAEQLRKMFDTGLLEKGRPGKDVIKQLADAAEPGLVGISSKRFYGWVMGSSHPAGVAADWLTSAWAQNSAIYQTSPSAAIAEEVAGKWLLDLLDLPRKSSFAFTTGATMASFICLAAARSEVLKKVGWDLEKDGLFGAPEIKVFLSEEAHSTIFSGLRFLGFGRNRLVQISSDGDGRMETEDLAEKLASYDGPKIIIAQAGHINSAAFDNFVTISKLSRQVDGWLHVDGAFGLWARTAPDYQHLCEGVDLADSWSVDGHKLLQVPYDSGYAIIKHPNAHMRAMTTSASYLNETIEDGRNPTLFVPELSRRARGFALWAVLQALGRDGVTELVDKNCKNAEQLAKRLAAISGIRLHHKLYFNQLAISFRDDSSDADHHKITMRTFEKLQEQQDWFLKEAEWKGHTILRISFSSMPNSSQEIDKLADAIIAAYQSVLAAPSRLTTSKS